MKKITIMIMLTALIFSFSGCTTGGNGNKSSEKQGKKASPQEDSLIILQKLLQEGKSSRQKINIELALRPETFTLPSGQPYALKQLGFLDKNLYLEDNSQAGYHFLEPGSNTLEPSVHFPETSPPALNDTTGRYTFTPAAPGGGQAIISWEESASEKKSVAITCGKNLPGISGFIGNDLLLVSENRQQLATYTKEGMKITDLMGISGPILDAIYTDHFVIALDSNNLCTFWRLADLSGDTKYTWPHLQLYVHSPFDWILWSKEGHYRAAGQGDNFLHLWQREGDDTAETDLPIGILEEQFRHTAYLEQLLAGNDYAKARSIAEKKSPVCSLEQLYSGENFYLTNPGENWKFLTHTKNKNNIVATTYFDRSELSSILISVEKTTSPIQSISLEKYMDHVLKNISGNLQSYKLSSREPLIINDRHGLLASYTGKIIGIDYQWYSWVSYSGFNYYNITGWKKTDNQSPAGIPANLMKIYNSIHIYSSKPVNENRILVSPHFGYTLNLENSDWQQWPDITKEYEYAELGAYTGNTTALLITPLYIGDRGPSVDSFICFFLASLEIEYDSSTITDYKKLNQKEITGVEFSCSDNDTYFFRIWRGNNYAYILTLFQGENASQSLTDAKKILDNFSPDFSRTIVPDYTQLNPQLAKKMSILLNNIGLYYHNNSQYLKSAQFFQLAYEANKEDSVCLENYLYAVSYAEVYNEGLEFLKRFIDNYADNMTILSFHAYFLKKTGEAEQARRVYKKLFARGYRQEYDFDDYLTLLWDMDKKEEAFKVLDEYQEQSPSLYITRRKADFLRKEKDFEAAIFLLQDAYLTSAYDENLALDLCYTYNDAGNYQEAVNLCNEVIEEDHRSAVIYFQKGINELNLNWYKEARDSLEQALELDPRNSEIQAELDYVTGLLGRGDNSLFKTEIDPVVVDEDYLRIDESSLPEKYTNSEAYYQYKIIAISYRKAQHYKITRYYSTKVLNNSGVATFSSFKMPFDPTSEGIYVNSLRVFDAEGNLQATGDPANYYVLDNTTEGMASDNKILNIPIAGLQTGYRIELSVTWEKRNPGENFSFYTDFLNRSHPMVHSYLIIQGDIAELAYVQRNIAPPQQTKDSLSWHYAKPTTYTWESYNTEPENYLPVVYAGNKANTWEKEAGDYLAEIETKLNPTAVIRDLAGELTTGMHSEAEKIQTLARYVQQNYTYKAIEFGRRAWIPNDGETILHNKYGDCKDMALLLHLLLKASGISSHLALVNSTHQIEPTIADLGQFNHMILFTPTYRSGYYLDPTNKYYDIAGLIPDGLGKKNTLILDPAKPRLAQLPDYPAGSYEIESERQVNLAEDGTVSVNEITSFRGFSASWMRAYLSQFDTDQRQLEIQSFLNSSGTSIQLDSYKIDNLNNSSRPLQIVLAYTLNKTYVCLKNQLIGELPAVWERYFIYLPHMTERQSPVQVYYPMKFTSRVTLNAPPGTTFIEPPGSAGDKTQYASWQVSCKYTKNQLNLDYNFSLNTGSYTPGEYNAFAAALNDSLKALEAGIVLEY